MVDTVYQPPAAMRPQKASWQKEMRNAPRRSGKQQQKWRAGMVTSRREEWLWLKGKGMSGTQRRYGLYLRLSLGELRSSPVQAASAGKLLIGLITEA